MRQTLVGILHMFVCHEHITNTSHPRAFSLLHRLVFLYHRTLVQKVRISPKKQHHIPDLLPQMDGTVAHKCTINFLALCTLCILGDVVDERSYMHPQQGGLQKSSQAQKDHVGSLGINGISHPERQNYWRARGCALQLIAWFRSAFSVYDSSHPQGEPQVAPGIDLPSVFITHVCRTLLRYKRAAELNGLDGAGFCESALFEERIVAAIRQDSAISSLWAAKCSVSPWRDDELSEVQILQPPSRKFQLLQKDEGDTTATLLPMPPHDYGPLPNWINEVLIPDISRLVITRRVDSQAQPIAGVDEMEVAGKTPEDANYDDLWERARKVTNWLASDVTEEMLSMKMAHGEE